MRRLHSWWHSCSPMRAATSPGRRSLSTALHRPSHEGETVCPGSIGGGLVCASPLKTPMISYLKVLLFIYPPLFPPPAEGAHPSFWRVQVGGDGGLETRIQRSPSPAALTLAAG